jgi:hypothetical protein
MKQIQLATVFTLLLAVATPTGASASELLGAHESPAADTLIVGTGAVVGGIAGCVAAAGTAEKLFLKPTNWPRRRPLQAALITTCAVGASIGSSALGSVGAKASELPSESEIAIEQESPIEVIE